MSDAVAVALIGFATSLVAAIFSLWNNIIARRNTTAIHETKEAVVTLEKNTNSIKDALVKATADAKFAEGVKAGSTEGADAKQKGT